MGPVNDKYYIKYNQDLDTYYIGKDEEVIVVERAQTKRSSREGNEKESQQLTWMRLIKPRKNKLKQKE